MDKFFQQRLARHQKKMMKYLRYVFNDHFVLVCLFLLGGTGLYYSNWIKTLPADFSLGGLIVAVFWFFCLFAGKFATLAEPADLVFLLPKEKEMKSYLKRGLRYSMILPAVFLILTGGFAMPLIVVSTGNPFSLYFVYLIMLFCLKISEFQVRWAALSRMPEKSLKMWRGIWIGTTFAVLLIALYLSVWAGVGAAVIQMLVFYWTLQKNNTASLNWEKMVKQEESRLYQIYRFINLFTDVPEVTARVKRKKYFDFLLNRIDTTHQNTYFYLYTRRFLRGSEFSGLYFRLLVIGALLSAVIAEVYISLIIGSLFLYLIGFQLLPLYNQFQYMTMTRIYPVAAAQKEKAVKKLLSIILTFAAIVFGLCSAYALPGTLLEKSIPIVVYLLVVLLFILIYTPRRLAKMAE